MVSAMFPSPRQIILTTIIKNGTWCWYRVGNVPSLGHHQGCVKIDRFLSSLKSIDVKSYIQYVNKFLRYHTHK